MLQDEIKFAIEEIKEIKNYIYKEEKLLKQNLSIE